MKKLNLKKQISLLLTLILLLTFVVSGCKKEDTSKEFDDYTNNLAKQIIEDSPINATFKYGDLEKEGLGDLLSELDDASPEEMEKLVSDSKAVLQYLKKVDRNSLTDEQQQTYDMIKFQNKEVVDDEPYLYYDNAFQPASGVQINVPIALMQIELETEDEVVAYIARCKKLPKLFSQYVDYEKTKLQDNLTLPASLYEAVIEEIDGMLVEPENFMMYLSFCDRVDALSTLDDAKRADYKAQFLEVVKNDIYPALQDVRAALEEIKDKTKNTKGISEWENGKDYYNYLVKYNTSYDMDTEDLRSWAQQQINDSTKTIQSYLAAHPEITSNEELMAMLPDVTTKAQMQQIEDQFISEAFYDYRINRASENIIPSYLQDYLPPAFYFPITLDGQDYGNMYMTQEALSNISLSTLETDMHEDLPGHHLYFSVLYGSDLPLIRKVYDFNAYIEGWAQYIQGKAYQYSAKDEETADFWRSILQSSYAYSVLLDIEVNYDGMSKDDAINEYLTMGYDEESAESSYNRMIANPGEMIDYYYGSYIIEGYLDKCKEEQGDKFDIKAFHDMILKHGGLPFTVMDKVVDDFIASSKEESQQ